ncbi:MAG TPA: cellulose synthase complex periplasmic endoglucanase BcsZ [Steroidobacteraceae bacterium]|nr:cellulose synthase complex periplasmic endoglucanase BcsZ [Steroidobacteraceae bacterium]
MLACVWLCGTGLTYAAEAQCDTWPQWQRFKQLYLSADGRVIDASNPAKITVSEGQSYALTFALIANDPQSFATVLQWTQNNLSGGDLGRTLPAWQWGQTPNGAWGVLDQNSASDADLWIAYTLLQAGVLWHNEHYLTLGQALARRILLDEVALIPGLGPALLPGPRGFVEHENWRLNPSYAPIQLLRAIGHQTHEKLWDQVLQSSQRLIIASAPHGAASDWLDYRIADGFVTDSVTQGIGSYDAIRVYLWAGMLPGSDPAYQAFSHQFSPLLALLAARPGLPEVIEPDSLRTRGDAHHGFYAALLPLLSRAHAQQLLQRYRARVDSDALRDDQHYYNDVLSLFGTGFLEDRYHFERDGALTPQWSKPCAAQ